MLLALSLAVPLILSLGLRPEWSQSQNRHNEPRTLAQEIGVRGSSEDGAKVKGGGTEHRGDLTEGKSARRQAEEALTESSRPESREGNLCFLVLNPEDVVDLSSFLQRRGESRNFKSLKITQHPELFERINRSLKFQAVKPGFARVTLQEGTSTHTIYTFISPVPSRHTTRSDLNWYKTQFGTGISNSNCGPALVSMAILWAKGTDVPVRDIRAEIGLPYEDGATSFQNLEDSLRRHAVKTVERTVSGPEDITRMIDRDHLVFVLLQTGGIDKVKGDPWTDLLGRYYNDSMGHYVLIKGYSLNKEYFVVYDPFPIDWANNNRYYGDGISMIGRNRYYSSRELLQALKTPMVLEIKRD